MKPLNAHWLEEFYNHITSAPGSSILINGWKATGIVDANKTSNAKLPSHDHFQENELNCLSGFVKRLNVALLRKSLLFFIKSCHFKVFFRRTLLKN